MNMRKYASYKQAAKRIIRLNQDPMKKQAFLGGLFGRRRKEYDDYGLPFDLAGGEGNIIDLGDEGRYISLGDGVMIPLPDNIGDDDYEEVGPKFKKESAYKRLVRLMGENRGLKKNAGFWDWIQGPLSTKAPHDLNGKKLKPEKPIAEWFHPNTYNYATMSDGNAYAVPREDLVLNPDNGMTVSSKEKYEDLRDNKPYVDKIPDFPAWFLRMTAPFVGESPAVTKQNYANLRKKNSDILKAQEARGITQPELHPITKVPIQKELPAQDAKPSGYSPVWNRKPRRIK